MHNTLLKISSFLILFFITSCFLIMGGRPLSDEILSYRFQRLGGGYSTLSEFDGDILIIYFFSSYCITCLKDLKMFKEKSQFLKEKKINIIGIGMDYNGEITLRPFVEYHRIDFPVMLVNKEILEGKWEFGRITTIPASILINRREKRYIIHTGNITMDTIKDII